MSQLICGRFPAERIPVFREDRYKPLLLWARKVVRKQARVIASKSLYAIESSTFNILSAIPSHIFRASIERDDPSLRVEFEYALRNGLDNRV